MHICSLIEGSLVVCNMASRWIVYVVVLVDYLTKWVEACATQNQTCETIARLLGDKVVCQHRVPAELLSDRWANLRLYCRSSSRAFAHYWGCTGSTQPHTTPNVMVKLNIFIVHFKRWWPSMPESSGRIGTCISSHTIRIYMYMHLLEGHPFETLIHLRRLVSHHHDLIAYNLDVQDYCSDQHQAKSSVWLAAGKNVVDAQKCQKRQDDKN